MKAAKKVALTTGKVLQVTGAEPKKDERAAVGLHDLDTALGGVRQYCPRVEDASTSELLLHALCYDSREFAHDAFQGIANDLSVLQCALQDEEPPSFSLLKEYLYRLERRCEAAAQVAHRVDMVRLEALKAQKGGAA
jgi:hypothetical protein